MVETGGLENRLRGDSHGGSNPSSSAITYLFRLSKFTGDYFLCARNLPDFIARTSEFRPKAIGLQRCLIVFSPTPARRAYSPAVRLSPANVMRLWYLRLFCCSVWITYRKLPGLYPRRFFSRSSWLCGKSSSRRIFTVAAAGESGNRRSRRGSFSWEVRASFPRFHPARNLPRNCR